MRAEGKSKDPDNTCVLNRCRELLSMLFVRKPGSAFSLLPFSGSPEIQNRDHCHSRFRNTGASGEPWFWGRRLRLALGSQTRLVHPSNPKSGLPGDPGRAALRMTQWRDSIGIARLTPQHPQNRRALGTPLKASPTEYRSALFPKAKSYFFTSRG